MIFAWATAGGLHLSRIIRPPRGPVTSTEGSLLAGFVARGLGTKRYLVRAVGPTLEDFGVPDPLSDPVLEVLNREIATVAANDDWSTAPDPGALRSAAVATGALALREGSRDAALLVTLDPGIYTLQVEEATAAGQGVALIEVSQVP